MLDKNMKVLFTSESVSEGHPDKVCDKIADSILDDLISKNPEARSAVEVLATKEKIVIAGEVTTERDLEPDYEKIARNILREIGYTSPEIGIGADTCDIEVLVKRQSPDISMGVKHSDDEFGAGDQGIMFGYASSETKNYMPLAIVVAHKLVRYASLLRHQGKLPHARPDMKSQVTIDYTDASSPKVDAVVFSSQHDEEVDIEEFRKMIREEVINPVISSFNMNLDFKTYINPTGRFVIGGPLGDTGLTGRKLIVDTYGGYCPHGGGAFSGKDPTKVDRTATYAARHAAKNIVAAGLASRCLIQLSYAIGVSEPVSISLNTYGTETVDKNEILKAVVDLFDFTPKGIIDRFNLFHPSFKYSELTNYGHFGRPDLDLSYEKLDYVEKLKKRFNK